ncbi:hypothetical protein [Fulvimonas yonginensis]|uniref:Uncharacterized protein n=1 Tax=Fulvimonas yonginensis TaxID=1495200 RepID=A0ABU8JE28_9GAMM
MSKPLNPTDATQPSKPAAKPDLEPLSQTDTLASTDTLLSPSTSSNPSLKNNEVKQLNT